MIPIKDANTSNPFASSLTLPDKNYPRTSDCAVMQLFEHAASTRLASCSEKVAICYANLSCNPIIIRHSSVSICHLHSYEYEYEFIIIYDKSPIPYTRQSYIKNFNHTVMVVDPWSNDHYFPNLDLCPTLAYNLGQMPNILQARSRFQVENFSFYPLRRAIFPYSFIDDTPFEIPMN